jgi:hypothetical protein
VSVNTKPSGAGLGLSGFRETTIGSIQPQRPPVALVRRRASRSSRVYWRWNFTVVMVFSM